MSYSFVIFETQPGAVFSRILSSPSTYLQRYFSISVYAFYFNLLNVLQWRMQRLEGVFLNRLGRVEKRGVLEVVELFLLRGQEPCSRKKMHTYCM